MAGDWIKVEVTLPDKPEVVRMAEVLHLDQDTVSGKCLRFWIWLNQQSENGNALSVTVAFIDRLCACEGFGAALEKVGWASFQNGTLRVPNFDRHNSKSAKQRALTQQRVKSHRDLSNGRVTTEKRSERYESVTREEKSVTLPKGSGGPARDARDARVSTANANNGQKETTTTTTTPAKSLPDPESECVPYADIVSAWAELCPELQPVRMRTPVRDAAIVGFWHFCAEKMENVRAVFAKVGQSNLLNGRPHRTKTDRKPYKTYFDKVISPDLAARIVEGVFDDEPAA